MMVTRRKAIQGSAAAIASAAIGNTRPAGTLDGEKPLVFAHRGASAWRPEHTLESYRRAIADGANFIEPDLVMTKDAVLVARHENEIGGTTDVASHKEFAHRHRVKWIDGKPVTGWFTEDFTFAELKTLRVIERLGSIRPESQRHDGLHAVPSFAEIIDFVAEQSAARGRMIGLIPELKHSTYFGSIGLKLEEMFHVERDAHDYSRRCPMIIQSFETANLVAIREHIGRPDHVQLLQLIGGAEGHPADAGDLSYGDMMTSAGLNQIASYADAIGPASRMLVQLDRDGRLGPATDIVERAHIVGLRVYPYTFRPENRFLPVELRGPGNDSARHEAGSIAEMRHYLALGIDGLFTDDPALGRRAIDEAVG